MLEYNESLRASILAIIVNKKTRKLVSRVKDSSSDATQSAARYVWKMAQVFGGRAGFNLHGPIMASMMLHPDARPIQKDLEDFARAIASRAYGSDDVFGARWRHALYGE